MHDWECIMSRKGVGIKSWKGIDINIIPTYSQQNNNKDFSKKCEKNEGHFRAFILI